jgi:hypothetical protein
MSRGSVQIVSSPTEKPISLAAGLRTGHSFRHQQGIVEGTPASGWSTIWRRGQTTGAQLYPWYDAALSSVIVVSDSTLDTGTLIVEGLDINYAVQTETLTLNGTTDVVGTKNFRRIYHTHMSGNASNVGEIKVEVYHVGDNAYFPVATIEPGLGQSQQAAYTVPAGHTAFLTSITAGSSKEASATQIALFARELGGAFRVKTAFFLSLENVKHTYDTPLMFPAGTDIDLRTHASQAAIVSGSFDITLVSNKVLV